MITSYRRPGRKLGKKAMRAVIDGVPIALVELRKLGRTLNKRAADILAFFDRPGTSNVCRPNIELRLPNWGYAA